MQINREELVSKHDFLNVVFDKGFSVLKSKKCNFNGIDVNLKDPNHYHHVYTRGNEQDYVGFGIKFQNMKKILLIRSPYTITNMTDTEYQLKILDDLGKKVIELIEFKPGQCYPIDFNAMERRFSLSNMNTPMEWSKAIKFRTIIEKVPKKMTVRYN